MNHKLCRKCQHLSALANGSLSDVKAVIFVCCIAQNKFLQGRGALAAQGVYTNAVAEQLRKSVIVSMDWEPDEFKSNYQYNKEFVVPSECPYILEHTLK